MSNNPIERTPMKAKSQPPELVQLPAEGTVVVLFGNHSCPPCDALKPHLAAEMTRRPGVIYLSLLPGETTTHLYKALNVRSSPTVVCLKNRVEVGRFSGMRPASTVTEILNRWNMH
jgi:thioredoxin-like negative regulator of GroEL